MTIPRLVLVPADVLAAISAVVQVHLRNLGSDTDWSYEAGSIPYTGPSYVPQDVWIKAWDTLRRQMLSAPEAPSEEMVAVAKMAVTDEAGSRLCEWTWQKGRRYCPQEEGKSTTCLCENVARAALAAVLAGEGT